MYFPSHVTHKSQGLILLWKLIFRLIKNRNNMGRRQIWRTLWFLLVLDSLLFLLLWIHCSSCGPELIYLPMVLGLDLSSLRLLTCTAAHSSILILKVTPKEF